MNCAEARSVRVGPAKASLLSSTVPNRICRPESRVFISAAERPNGCSQGPARLALAMVALVTDRFAGLDDQGHVAAVGRGEIGWELEIDLIETGIPGRGASVGRSEIAAAQLNSHVACTG